MLYTPDRLIRYVKINCPHCDQDGNITVSRGNFREHLDFTYRGKYIKVFRNGKIFRWALDEYREWKKTGKISCPDCNGAKTWVEPR